MSRQSIDFMTTGTQLEPLVLSALRSGKVWRTKQLYRVVQEICNFKEWDELAIPKEYKTFKEHGVDVTEAGFDWPQKAALAEQYGIGTEPLYQNCTRQAVRQLKGRGEANGDKSGRYWIGRFEPDPMSNKDVTDWIKSQIGAEEQRPVGVNDDAWQLIKQRRGQGKFRRNLLERYGVLCMVSGTTIPEIIEAAHICPVSDGGSFHVGNGLLLRADLHTLFDLNLLGIEPVNLTIHFNERVATREYSRMNGKRLKCKINIAPDEIELKRRWAQFQV